MNANDVIAHYAAERLGLMLELEQAKKRIAELEAQLKKDTDHD